MQWAEARQKSFPPRGMNPGGFHGLKPFSVNHCIAKKIVAKAEDTNSAIGVEDLGGISGRTQFRGPEQRSRMKGWAFAQLRVFITYKAELAGIPVIPIDPAYTSQTCPECGHRERNNRKTRDDFVCLHCGHSSPADVVGARNIRREAIQNWAAVKAPNVGIDDAGLETRSRSLTSRLL